MDVGFLEIVNKPGPGKILEDNGFSLLKMKSWGFIPRERMGPGFRRVMNYTAKRLNAGDYDGNARKKRALKRLHFPKSFHTLKRICKISPSSTI